MVIIIVIVLGMNGSLVFGSRQKDFWLFALHVWAETTKSSHVQKQSFPKAFSIIGLVNSHKGAIWLISRHSQTIESMMFDLHVMDDIRLRGLEITFFPREHMCLWVGKFRSALNFWGCNANLLNMRFTLIKGYKDAFTSKIIYIRRHNNC